VTQGSVASVDGLATEAGLDALAAGGSAADAAIATNAGLAVTHPHMCGPGGDLFALVHDAATGEVTCLDAAGRSGSLADLDRLRADGHHRHLPLTGDLRAATIPGCVDGWLALHERHGRLPFAALFEPALALARDGFEPVALLSLLQSLLDEPADRSLAPTLEAIATGDRDAFYLGPFGQAFVALPGSDAAIDDLAAPQARWVDPISLQAWGHTVWTVPPPSQGYLILSGVAVAERLGFAPGAAPDPEDAAWADLLMRAVSVAGTGREAELHEAADPAALLDPGRLDDLADRVRTRTSTGGPGTRPGDTTYLCAADRDGLAVSLIQSLAGPLGSQIAVPGTGVYLQNRGVGFSVDPEHPAAYGPGRRPPHTLSPALVTRPDRSLRAVLGTQGGDAQPFVVTELLARLLVAGEEPADVLDGPRAVPHRPGDPGFALWDEPDDHVVKIEATASDAWAAGLVERGHRVERAHPDDGVGFGHAQLIERAADGTLVPAADPRSPAAGAGSV
jgi:gamma-glutamyltranspeptidase/glutathione hydrolase